MEEGLICQLVKYRKLEARGLERLTRKELQTMVKDLLEINEAILNKDDKT